MGSQEVIEENDLSASREGIRAHARIQLTREHVCMHARNGTPGIDQFETRIAGFTRVYAPGRAYESGIKFGYEEYG